MLRQAPCKQLFKRRKNMSIIVRERNRNTPGFHRDGEPGRVFLVGAGPGDPELITLKGLRSLRKADVVVYDRLICPELLAEAPAQAERVFVGKQAGHHS